MIMKLSTIHTFSKEKSAQYKTQIRGFVQKSGKTSFYGIDLYLIKKFSERLVVFFMVLHLHPMSYSVRLVIIPP